MPDTEKQEMKLMIEEMLNKQTEDIKKYVDLKVGEVNKTLDPIADIYDSTRGFSKVVRFFFKEIFIPLSIIVGLILSIKKIFFGYHTPINLPLK